MKVLVLHCYSATNLGDGLLVDEALDVVREAFPGAQVTVMAHYPDTFDLGPEVQVLDAGVLSRRSARDYRALWSELDTFDLIVGVGGGYLRSGYPMEGAKTHIIHSPQLALAVKAKAPAVYLPQSIGPIDPVSMRAMRPLLARLTRLHLRDDRSMQQVATATARRTPDLALLSRDGYVTRPGPPEPTPVLSVRAVRGEVAPDVKRLAELLGSFDGYIQSTVGSNNDTEAMGSLGPLRIIPKHELLDPDSPQRVVVAMRLHGALMALRAGHLVIHLAYERKGFGAFQDLEMSEFVYNFRGFDAAAVRDQVDRLIHDADFRAEYFDRVTVARERMLGARSDLISDLRSVSS